MAEQNYAAFISYRHARADQRWAKWLLKKIETYQTPKYLVRRGCAARLGKVFRDEDEFSAAPDLSEHIKTALRQSDHLIVICSPQATESDWINQEIAYFKSLGKGDKIMALLIDGEPATAYPRELLSTNAAGRSVEPIAADMRPRDRQSRSSIEKIGFLRLAARLLDCSFDDLRQRDAERRRIRRTIGITLTGSVLAALCFAGVVAVQSIQTAIESEISEKRTVLSSAANEGERMVSEGLIDQAAAALMSGLREAESPSNLRRFFSNRFTDALQPDSESVRTVIQTTAERLPMVWQFAPLEMDSVLNWNLPYLLVDNGEYYSVQRIDATDGTAVFDIEKASVDWHCDEILGFAAIEETSTSPKISVACLKTDEQGAKKFVVLIYADDDATERAPQQTESRACPTCLQIVRGMDILVPDRMPHDFYYGHFSEDSQFLLITQNEEMLLIDLQEDPAMTQPISARADFQRMGYDDPGTVNGRILPSSNLLVMEAYTRDNFGRQYPTALWLRLGGIEPINFTMSPLNNFKSAQSAEGWYVLLVDRRGVSLFSQGRIGGRSDEPGIPVTRMNYDAANIKNAGLFPEDETHLWIYTEEGYLEFYDSGIADEHVTLIGIDAFEQEPSHRFVERYYVGGDIREFWVSPANSLLSVSRTGIVREWRAPTTTNTVDLDLETATLTELCAYFEARLVMACDSPQASDTGP